MSAGPDLRFADDVDDGLELFSSFWPYLEGGRLQLATSTPPCELDTVTGRLAGLGRTFFAHALVGACSGGCVGGIAAE